MSRVVLTQPEPRVEALADFVRAHGHEVVCLPAGRIETLACSAWQDWVEGHTESPPDWVIFVSPGAIDAARELAWPATWPASTGLAVIGPGTRQALLRAPGLGAHLRIVQPARAPFDADALMRESPFDAPAGLRVQVVQGADVRSSWVDALAARGAQVSRAEVYRHRADPPDASVPGDDLRAWVTQTHPVAFVMTSSGGVRLTTQRLRDVGLGDWALSQVALVQHPRIAEACEHAGWRRVRSIEPGREALLAALESV